MPLATLITITAGIAALALAGWVWLKRSGPKPFGNKIWLMTGFGSVLLTFGSAMMVTERQSGTGDLKSYGWPKPYCVAWEGWENGSRSSGCNQLYLVGDLLFYGSLVLALAVLWRIVTWFGRRRK
jgi:hypothetical protein